jgi:alkanesulfonate monooxygenase SsuD/methylene tetrahydromethanopterin reductase-like flavin-dependent oxidoreductase (luciferase family)
LRLLGRPPLLVALGHKELIDNDFAATKRRGPLAPAARQDIWDATPEELARKVTICGTPDEAIGQIEEFIRAGVRLFALWLPYEDTRATEETMENYERIILPYFVERNENR